MSDNQKDKPTLSMKVLKGPKQIEREKTETIWDRFERLQRSLAPYAKENKSKGEFIVSRKRMKQNLCLLKRRPLQVQNLQRS